MGSRTAGFLLAMDIAIHRRSLNCVSLADLSAGGLGYRDHPRLARDFVAADSARERFLWALTILWAVYFVEGAPRCTYDSRRSPGPPLRCSLHDCQTCVWEKHWFQFWCS